MIIIKNRIINMRLIFGLILVLMAVIYSIFNLDFLISCILIILLFLYGLYVILIGYKQLILTSTLIVCQYVFYKKRYEYTNLQKVKIQKIGINSTVNFIELRFKKNLSSFVLDEKDNIGVICDVFLEKKCKVEVVYNTSIHSNISKEQLLRLEKNKPDLFTMTVKKW